MRMGNFLTLLIAFALPAVLLGQAKGKSSAKTAASRLAVMPAGDLKWADLDPSGAPGAVGPIGAIVICA